MNNEETDQVQPEGQEAEATDNQGETQSEDSGGSEKLFRVDGKDVTAEELYEKTQNLNKGFTQTRQELAELRKELSERAEQSKVGKQALDTVPDDVKDTVWKIVEGRVQDILSEKDQKVAAQDRQKQWESRLDEVEKTYDGSGGKPKFNRNVDEEKILEYIKEDGRDFDAMSVYEKLHKDEIRDWWVKDAMTKKAGTAPTERTSGTPGGSTLSKSGKTAKNLSEASERLYQRLSSS